MVNVYRASTCLQIYTVLILQPVISLGRPSQYQYQSVSSTQFTEHMYNMLIIIGFGLLTSANIALVVIGVVIYAVAIALYVIVIGLKWIFEIYLSKLRLHFVHYWFLD